jgi:hypothetical protein
MTFLRIAGMTCGVLFATIAGIHADVRTEEKTSLEIGGMLGRVVNIFAGKEAREGLTSTVAVKGSRKATFNGTTGQIIDLAEEKIYDLDMTRKSYQVTTFADLRKRMLEAKEKAEKAVREEQAKEQPLAQSTSKPEDQVDIDFEVKNTGQARSINGFQTQQAVAVVTVREKGKTLDQSGGLTITTEMWMAPKIAAMQEVFDFEMQYAQKLYGPMIAGASPQDMAAVTALYPGIRPALERMTVETGKIEGTPILGIVKIEGVKSAEQFAQEQKRRADDSRPNMAAGVGGLLGGLARRAAQNKVEGEPSQRATVMTTTNEVLKVTTQVSATDVAIPAGFKEQ